MLLWDRYPVSAVRIFPGGGAAEDIPLLTVISLGTRVVLAYALAPSFGVDAIWWAVGWLGAGRYNGSAVGEKAVMTVKQVLAALDSAVVKNSSCVQTVFEPFSS